MNIIEREIQTYKHLYSEQLARLINKKIFITGANGLIATALLSLLKNEQIEIFEYHHGDDLPENLNRVKPDYIIHCGSITDSKKFSSIPVEVFESIVPDTITILNYCKNHPSKLIFLSSLEVYGIEGTKTNIVEDQEVSFCTSKVRNSYPAFKSCAEMLCCAYKEEYSVDVVILRLASTFGLFSKENDNRVYNKIARSLCANEDIILSSDGKAKKGLLYSLDCAGAILCVMLNSPDLIYNVENTANVISIIDLIELLIANFNTNIVVKTNNDLSEAKYLAKNCNIEMSAQKLNALGWKPYRNLLDIFEIELEKLKLENYCSEN